MLDIGMGMFFLFGSALDGPGNDMRIVYGGIIIGLILMYAGAKLADLWMRGMKMGKKCMKKDRRQPILSRTSDDIQQKYKYT